MRLSNLLKNKACYYALLVMRSLLLSAVIVATFSKIPIPKAEMSEPASPSWIDTNWLYRKSITIPNPSSTLTNEDVLVNIDTSSLISANKLQNNCADLRFVDDDGTTYLSYWVEDGCNTTNTNVWVRIPSLPNGGKNIMMYYSNSSATDEALTWNGNIYMYSDTSCPSGWTRASALDTKFLYGSTTFGNTGGSSSHSQGDSTCTSSSISTTNVSASSSSGATGTTTSHTHTSLKASLGSVTVLPPYEDMVLCYSNHFTISSGLITLFATTPSSGWTRVSALDNIFARANSTYGVTGGSSTHTNPVTVGYVTGTETGTSSTQSAPFSATGGTISTSGGYTIHKFTSSGTFTTNQAGTVDVLVVGAGGGGGGGGCTGGGGGGGLIYQTSYSVAAGGIGVTVGSGSTGNGGNSVFSALTAIGGGKGGPDWGAGTAGGSGGGGGSKNYDNSGAGTAGQGNRGGSGGYAAGGGGGGAGGVGGDYTGGSENWGGRGGIGLANSITGSSVYYAGGGAAAGSSTGGCGSAQAGGTACATNGAANTGAGGGGGSATTGGSGVVIVRYPTPAAATGTIAALSHTHTSVNAAVSSASNVPPYLTMLFEKADSNKYVNESNVVITSELPPLGWQRFTQLDNKFAMGSATYGSTGGSATHTHSVSITTGTPSATVSSYGTGTNFADSTHTHSCTTTSASASNIPPYYSVIYTQRKTSLETTLGTEEGQNTKPNNPSALLTEELYNPTNVVDTTPEFSAIFSDPDTSDTGNYYQIQVNTSSDFTGTTMWDTTKTSFVTPIANNSRTTNVAYAGSTLQEGTTYYWRVKFWDNNGYASESDWSDVYQFTMDNTPTAAKDNIIGATDIYAGKQIDVTTVYSDLDGIADLDKLYLQIKNPSGINIEYYATSSTTTLTNQTPTAISGSEYVSDITYDIVSSSPTTNDVSVTWHITTNWNWTRSTAIQYGVKATDIETAESIYDFAATTYKYENQLTFAGTLQVTDTNSNTVSNGEWVTANLPIVFTGITVVYEGTSNIYPNDNDFDVQIVNTNGIILTDQTSSGKNIFINTATDDTTSTLTYTVSITNIPTGGTDASGNPTYIIKVDNTSPIISNLTSSTYVDSNTWYTQNSSVFTWTSIDNESGIKNTWYLLDNSSSTSANDVMTSGAVTSTNSITLNNIENGIWYLHMTVQDNCNNTATSSYSFKIDSSAPDIIAITGTNDNVWQNVDAGPIISWTNPNSLSGDTFYITNDGSTPTSSNYVYLTTNNSYDLPDQNEGQTIIKVTGLNGAGVYSSTRSFTVKYDNTNPSITSLYSTTHPDENMWYADTELTISWATEDHQSGIYKIWKLFDQTPLQDSTYIMGHGIEDQISGSYHTTVTQEGSSYFHLLVMDNKGLITTKTFTVNIDTKAPALSSLASSTHPSQNMWYSNKLATFTWTTSDTGSGIQGVWKLVDQNRTHTQAEVLTQGSQSDANTTWTTPELADGVWYLHLVVKDNTNKTTYTNYKLQIDSSTPDIVAITGRNNNIWQNTNSGPIISWTDPLSLSDDTFYITTDGSTPTSSNYAYFLNISTYDLPDQKQGETTVKVRALNGAGTYSETRTFVVRYDTTPPANVTNASTYTASDTITLTWHNPSATDFGKVLIIKNTDHAPLTITDGTKIYEGNASTYTDANLISNTTYYYTIFASDTAGNLNSGNTIKAITATTTTNSEQPLEPDETTKIVKIQDLTEDQKVNIVINQQSAVPTNTGDVHVYAEQTINVEVPAGTITDNATDIKHVLLKVDSQTYIMTYDAEKNTYKTTISAPAVKGVYDTQIQVITNDDTNKLAITMSLNVDPYGYIYSKSGNNEIRISNATVTLYKNENNTPVVWHSTENGSINPQTTNQTGEYQFFVEPGEYKIVVEANGYKKAETEWFTVENNVIEKNIELKSNSSLLFILEVTGAAIIILCITLIIIFKYKRK